MSDATRASVLKQVKQEPSAETLAEEMTALLSETYLVQGRLTHVFSTIKDSVGLTGTESLTLYTVVNSNKPVTVPQIGRSLGHARQVIQRAANALVQRGLLATQENPAHKRAAFLVATDAGRAMKEGFDIAGRAFADTLVGGMDRETVLATREGLRQLRHAVEQRARELPLAPVRGKKPAGK